jgi:hypothetical protein
LAICPKDVNAKSYCHCYPHRSHTCGLCATCHSHQPTFRYSGTHIHAISDQYTSSHQYAYTSSYRRA